MTSETQETRPRVARAATRKRKRLYMVLAGMAMLGISVALVLTAFEDSIVFFYTPSDLTGKDIRPGQRMRLGGLVEEGSIRKGADGLTTYFVVTDLTATVPVSFKGILPDLFREGQGVVDEFGRCHDMGNLYIADTGVFPQCPSVNPMWTAMALAHRTASVVAASH